MIAATHDTEDAMGSISRRAVVLGAMAAPFVTNDIRLGAARAAAASMPPTPPDLLHVRSKDMRAWAASMSRSRPPDTAARAAYIKRKALSAYIQPVVPKEARLRAAQYIADRGAVPLDTLLDQPTPGGFASGVIYNYDFVEAWQSGTAIAFTVLCPERPGGNVYTWLYLTAANRSALGVEAFVSYYAQLEPFFKVYDWAQAPFNPWVLEIPMSALGDYLVRDASAQSSRALTIWNSTYSIGGLMYRNEVFLYNHLGPGWDLFYQYDYGADPDQHRSHAVNYWGPIVETFQPVYTGTNPLGYMRTRIAAADDLGRWSKWDLLNRDQSWVLPISSGFDLRYMAPNFAYTVTS